jgi:hypothetical protein
MVIEEIYAKNARGEQITREEVNFLFTKLAEKNVRDSGVMRDVPDQSGKLLRLDLMETRVKQLKDGCSHITEDHMSSVSRKTSNALRDISDRNLHTALEAFQVVSNQYFDLIREVKKL